jgi:hypothetical protein
MDIMARSIGVKVLVLVSARTVPPSPGCSCQLLLQHNGTVDTDPRRSSSPRIC